MPSLIDNDSSDTKTMKKIVLGACVLALLPACSKHSAAPAATQTSSASESAPTPSRADGARVNDYKRALLPLMAGSYGGECRGMAGAASKEGVTISSAGVASAQGWKRDVMSPTDSVTLTRSPPGAPGNASLIVNGSEPKWTLLVTTDAGGSVTFGDGDALTMCQQSSQAKALLGSSLYPAISHFFISGAAVVPCLADSRTQAELPIKAGADSVSVGDKVYSLVREVGRELATVDFIGRNLT